MTRTLASPKAPAAELENAEPENGAGSASSPVATAGPAEQSVLWRLRLVAGVLLLAAVAFRQAGGVVVPDTKLDLTENPGGFLARALHMWDPAGALGQLQNQAYGYLFPVGPFHLALGSAGVPEWVVQRLWWTTVLAVGFLGVWRLSGALGMGDPWARYVAALLYALGPRFLSEVAVTSVEVWPMAVAPWVLLPLVLPGKRTWRWRILWSALAFAATGGVNAVASAVALVVPTVWFATRTPARLAAIRFATWLAAVVAVALWWLIPLALLGRYSPPFLDWIENAPVTTAFASPFEAIRGTSPWLNYLSGPAGPAWPAGWQFVTLPALVVATTMLAALGLAGLRLAPQRHRAFLGLSVLVGLALVTLGHTGVAASPTADSVQQLLDGALAPLRNTHKFEMVVRLPLTLGLALSLARVARWMRRLGLATWLIPVAAVSAVGLLAAPAINAGLPRPDGYSAIPGYWRDAASWLDGRAEPGTVLVVPAAGFADFIWGSTKDDPLQALSTRPFAVRDAVPLGSAGSTRWLDAVERSLQSGTGGDRLHEALESAGIRHLVVRNDLRADAVDSGGGQGLRVHEAIANGGFTRVATFGPPVGSPPRMPQESATETVDRRTRLPYPSIEVFAVAGSHDAVVVDAAGLALVDGGAEDVPDALRAVPGAGAAIVGSDVRDLPDELTRGAVRVATDGNQDREVFFGRASNNTSSVLTSDSDRRTGRSTDDYVADPDALETVRRGDGDLAHVSASSSASDANASLRLGPGYGPQAAVDGDPGTAWVSGTFGSSVGEWLNLDLARTMDVTGLTVTLEEPPRRVGSPSEVRVDTDRGTATSRLLPGAGPQRVAVPAGSTASVRVTVTGMGEGPSANGAGIAEIGIPGAELGTRLTVPTSSATPTDVLVIRRAEDGRRQCAWVVDRPLCTSQSARQPESEGGLRRSLTLPSELTGPMSGEVVARAGDGVERLLAGLTSVEVTASSRSIREPAGRPAAAMDGELGTGWVAARDDESPTLTISLPRAVRTDRLQLQRDAYLAASAPSEVQVSLDGGRPLDLTVDDEGFLRWPKQTVSRVSLRFGQTQPLHSTDSTSGFIEELPVGVSEVLVPGVDPRGSLRLTSPTGASCGFGPELRVGDREYSTSVSGTLEDVVRGMPLDWTLCADDDVTLAAGEVSLDAEQSAEFEPTALTVTRSGVSGAPAATPVVLSRNDGAQLAAEVPASSAPALLVVPQNYNVGWVARDTDGSAMTAVRVNGWQQGWVVPAGAARTVGAAFGPDGSYRAGLAGGAMFLLACTALALWPSRREGDGVLPGRRAHGWAWNAVAVVLLTWLSGPMGALACGTAFVVAYVLRSPRAEAAAAVVAMVMAGVLVAAAPPWPAGRAAVDDSLVQWLVLVAVAVCVLAPVGTSGAAELWSRVSPRRPHRMTGRSTP